MIWNFGISVANAMAGLQRLNGAFDTMWSNFGKGIGDSISKFNAWKMAFDYLKQLTKQLINESRDLIATSTKYDIPISKMGGMQVMAEMTGQSVGQLARGFRFLEMNMNKAVLKPGGPQYQALKELGVSQDEIYAATQNTSYALDLVRSRIMSIGDEERRNAFLQEIFGANWQNLLPIIEANANTIQEATDAGYKYSESMTQSLNTINKDAAELGQMLKPIVMPFAQLLAILANIAMIIVTGLVTGIKLIGEAIKLVFNAVISLVARIVQGMGYISKFGAMIGKSLGIPLSDAAEVFSDGLIEGTGKAAEEAETGVMKNLGKMGDTATEGGRNITKYGNRTTQSAYGFAESLGLVEENAREKELIAEYESNQKELANVKSKVIATQKKMNELSAKQRKEGLSLEESILYGSLRAVQEELGKQEQKLAEANVALRRKVEAAGGSIGGAASGGTPLTAEERKIEIQKGQQARERYIQYAMANKPLQAEIDTVFELGKAIMELNKLEQDRQDLIDRGALDRQKEADFINSIEKAKISIMEKERAHKLFILQKERELYDSEKERRDNIIKAVEKREQTFMARQGKTGIDKQTVALENAIEQMQRDQERADIVEKDKLRGQAEKEQARKKVEESTIKAMEELDKLTLMQFQYGASDAAKKGMGGGIDIRENQLQISKSQLEVLQKQYDLMLKQFGLSPDRFGNVPFMMQGAQRMK